MTTPWGGCHGAFLGGALEPGPSDDKPWPYKMGLKKQLYLDLTDTPWKGNLKYIGGNVLITHILGVNINLHFFYGFLGSKGGRLTWNLQPSPMKRQENDLNQASMRTCSSR